MKKELQELIAQGKTGKAIDLLLKIAADFDEPDIQQDVLLLSARFQEYSNEKRRGINSDEQQKVTLSRINMALLEIIERLPEKVGKGFNGWLGRWTLWERMLGIGVIVGVLVGLVVFTGADLSFFWSGKKPNGPLQLTVYVHGAKGKQDIVLEDEGKLIVDFGNDRRTPKIGENGRTNFGEIPSEFYNKSIPINVVASGFEVVNPDSAYLLDGNPIYFEVKRDRENAWIKGIIRDRKTLEPIPVATILVGIDTSFFSDSLGRIKFYLPEKMRKNKYDLKIVKENYQVYSTDYYSDSNDFEVLLDKK